MSNELVERFRTQFPDLTEDQLTWELGQRLFREKTDEDIQRLEQTYPTFTKQFRDMERLERQAFAPTMFGEATEGLRRGWEGLKGVTYGAGGIAAHKLAGPSAVRDWFLRKAKEAEEEAGKHGATVQGIGDIRGPGDAIRWMLGGFGEVAPTLAEAVVTSAIGAAAGSTTAPGPGTAAGAGGGFLAGILRKQAMRRLVKKGITEFADDIGKAALRKELRAIAATHSGQLTAALNSYALNAGEIYSSLANNPKVDPDTALNYSLLGGLVNAVPDSVLPSYIIGKFFRGVPQKVAHGYMLRALKEASQTIPMEGLTESFQEFVAALAEKWADPTRRDLPLDQPFFERYLGSMERTLGTRTTRERLVQAGFLGAMGGALAAPAAAIPGQAVEGKPEPVIAPGTEEYFGKPTGDEMALYAELARKVLDGTLTEPQRQVIENLPTEKRNVFNVVLDNQRKSQGATEGAFQPAQPQPQPVPEAPVPDEVDEDLIRWMGEGGTGVTPPAVTPPPTMTPAPWPGEPPPHPSVPPISPAVEAGRTAALAALTEEPVKGVQGVPTPPTVPSPAQPAPAGQATLDDQATDLLVRIAENPDPALLAEFQRVQKEIEERDALIAAGDQVVSEAPPAKEEPKSLFTPEEQAMEDRLWAEIDAARANLHMLVLPIPVDVLKPLTQLAGLYVKAHARNLAEGFQAFVEKAIKKFGESIRQYLAEIFRDAAAETIGPRIYEEINKLTGEELTAAVKKAGLSKELLQKKPPIVDEPQGKDEHGVPYADQDYTGKARRLEVIAALVEHRAEKELAIPDEAEIREHTGRVTTELIDFEDTVLKPADRGKGEVIEPAWFEIIKGEAVDPERLVSGSRIGSEASTRLTRRITYFEDSATGRVLALSTIKHKGKILVANPEKSTEAKYYNIDLNSLPSSYRPIASARLKVMKAGYVGIFPTRAAYEKFASQAREMQSAAKRRAEAVSAAMAEPYQGAAERYHSISMGEEEAQVTDEELQGLLELAIEGETEVELTRERADQVLSQDWREIAESEEEAPSEPAEAAAPEAEERPPVDVQRKHARVFYALFGGYREGRMTRPRFEALWLKWQRYIQQTSPEEMRRRKFFWRTQIDALRVPMLKLSGIIDPDSGLQIVKNAIYDTITRYDGAGREATLKALVQELNTVTIQRAAESRIGAGATVPAAPQAATEEGKTVEQRTDDLLRELAQKASQVGTMPDPTILGTLIKLGVVQMEAGYRKFADWAPRMVELAKRVGAEITRILKNVYLAARAVIQRQGKSTEGIDDIATVNREYEKFRQQPKPLDQALNQGQPGGPPGGGPPVGPGGGRPGQPAGPPTAPEVVPPAGEARPAVPGVHSGARYGYPPRPGIRVASENLLPVPENHIGNRYPILDPTQRLGVNLMLNRFLKDKGEAFLLADGTGVGKTMEEIVVALEIGRRTGRPSLIVTTSQTVIENNFTDDAARLGLNLEEAQRLGAIEIITYTDLGRKVGGLREYGVAIFDEAHNLKNPGTKKSDAGWGVKAQHKVYATATPMDKPVAGAYFFAQITDRDPEDVARDLGFRIRDSVDNQGNLKREPVLLEGVTFEDVLDKIKLNRDIAIRRGSMVRREYPFFGDVQRVLLRLPEQAVAEQKAIMEYWEARMAAAQPRVRGFISGQRTQEMSRWTEPQKLNYLMREMIKDLRDGKSVVVMAEGVDETRIQGTGKTHFGVLSQLMAKLDQLRAAAPEQLKPLFRYSEITGQITGRGRAEDVKAFQRGDNRIAICTPQTGGVGINLDDQVGGRPRMLYMLSPNFSGDVFEQMLGRVSRRNTQSPATVRIIVFSDAFSDHRRLAVLDAKLAALAAINRGEDVDRLSLASSGLFVNASGELQHQDIDMGEASKLPTPKITIGPYRPGELVIMDLQRGSTYENRERIKTIAENAEYTDRQGDKRKGWAKFYRFQDGSAGWVFPEKIERQMRDGLKDLLGDTGVAFSMAQGIQGQAPGWMRKHNQLSTLLEDIVKRGKKEEKEIARLLLKRGVEAPIKWYRGQKGSMMPDGWYIGEGDIEWLNRQTIIPTIPYLQPGDIGLAENPVNPAVQVALHEGLHRFTLRALHSPFTPEEVAFEKEMRRIWRLAKPVMDKNQFNVRYGIASVHEFVAMLASPAFRAELNQVYDPQARSIWAQIWDAILKLFGVKSGTALESALEALYNLDVERSDERTEVRIETIDEITGRPTRILGSQVEEVTAASLRSEASERVRRLERVVAARAQLVAEQAWLANHPLVERAELLTTDELDSLASTGSAAKEFVAALKSFRESVPIVKLEELGIGIDLPERTGFGFTDATLRHDSTRLRKLGAGGEGLAAEDTATGTVYKFLLPQADGGIGLVLNSTLDIVSGTLGDLIERVSVLNDVGVPTELVGVDPSGTLILKQPKGGSTATTVLGRAPEAHMESVGFVPLTQEAAVEFGMDASISQALSRSGLGVDYYVGTVRGQPWILSDIKTGNFVFDRNSNLRLLDFVPLKLTPELLEVRPRLSEFLRQQQPVERPAIAFMEAPSGEINAQWIGNIRRAAAKAGLNMQVLMRGTNGLAQELAGKTGGQFDGAARVVTIVTDSVIGQQDVSNAFHEIGHYVFAGESPEIRERLVRALATVTDAELGLDLSQDPRIRQGKGMERERLIEATARRLVAEGFNPQAAQTMGQRIVRWFEHVFLRVCMILQQALYGPEFIEPALALRYIALQVRRFLAGDRGTRPSYIETMGGNASRTLTFRRLGPRRPLSERMEGGNILYAPVPNVDAEGVSFNLQNLEFTITSTPGERSRKVQIEKIAALLNHQWSLVEEAAKDPVVKDAAAKLKVEPESLVLQAIGLGDPLGTRNLLEGATETDGTPVEYDPTKTIDGFLGKSNQDDVTLRALQDVQRIRDQIARKTELAEKAKQIAGEKKEAALKEFEDTKQTYLNFEKATSKMVTAMRREARRLLANIASGSEKLGTIAQQLRQIDPNANLKEYAPIFQKLFGGNYFSEQGLSLLTLIEELVIKQPDLFDQSANQIKQALAQSENDSLKALADGSKDNNALLATLIAFAKTHKMLLHNLELRREKNAALREKIKGDLDNLRAEGDTFVADLRALARTAKMEDRVRKAYRDALREIRALIRRVDNNERKLAGLASASKVFDRAYRELAAKLQVGADAVWGNGMKYNAAKPGMTVDQVRGSTKELSIDTSRDKVTNPEDLERDLRDMVGWLSERESEYLAGSSEALDGVYQGVRNQVREITLHHHFNFKLFPAERLGFELTCLPEGRRMLEAFGTPAAQTIDRMFNHYVTVFYSMRQDAERFGRRNDQLENELLKMFPDHEVNKREWLRENVLNPAKKLLQTQDDMEEQYANNPDGLKAALRGRLALMLRRHSKTKGLMDQHELEFMGKLWRLLEYQQEANRWLIENAIKAESGVKDPRLTATDPATGELVQAVRRHLSQGTFTYSQKLSPMFETMVNALRQSGWRLAPQEFSKIAEIWKQDGGPAKVGAMVAKYFSHPIYGEQVRDKFFRALVESETVSVFESPSQSDGVTKLPANLGRVITAYHSAGGDPVGFAVALHALHEGSPEEVGQYVQDVMKTLAGIFKHVDNIQGRVDGTMTMLDRRPSAGDEIRNMLADALIDARLINHLPGEWFNYHSFDQRDLLSMSMRVAAQTAFGRGQERLARAYDTLENEVEQGILKLKAVRDELMSKAKSKHDLNRLLDERLGKVEHRRLKKFEQHLRRIANSAQTTGGYFRKENDPDASVKASIRMAQQLGSLAVNQPSSAMYQMAALIDMPIRYGISGGVVKATARGIALAGKELAASFAQAIGVHLFNNSYWHQKFVELGYNDPTAYKKLHDAFDQLENESRLAQTFRAANDLIGFKLNWLGREAQHTSLRPLQPFTTSALVANRALTETFWRFAETQVMKGVEHYRNHPEDFKNLDHRLTSDILGLKGFAKNSFDRFVYDLNRWGLDYNTMVRDGIGRQHPLSDESLGRLYAMMMAEVSSESSLATMPAASYNNSLIRFVLPLLGWSFRRMSRVGELRLNAEGKAELNATIKGLSAIFVMGLGGLALGMLVDDYYEKLLGKKRNLRALTLDQSSAGLAEAVMENIARVGTLGLLGEMMNGVLSVGHGGDNRALSVDGRVIACSAFQTILRAGMSFVNQGDIDYARVVRPLMASLGGNGLLQYMQFVNHTFGTINEREARFTRRLNAQNYLRVIGRQLDMEVRYGGGAYSTPTPMTPEITRMELAVYGNDPTAFEQAFRAAKLKAAELGREDPEQTVIRAFASRHPLVSVFRTRPTERQYREILMKLPSDGADDVREAVRLFNYYLERLGAKPFEGKEVMQAPRRFGLLNARSAALSALARN